MELNKMEKIKYIQAIFDGYKNRKDSGNLYDFDNIPQKVLENYYMYIENPVFEDIFNSFREKYIENESKLENVHEEKEILGLGKVYDHIQSYLAQKDINIYLTMKLHQILYSKCPHPEFGGKLRDIETYLEGSTIETECYQIIPQKIAMLYNSTNDLVNEGLLLGKSNDINQIFEYINKCIKLKCELIRIHPFSDGNGRTSRAFLNVLFKLAKIPPVYVVVNEKKEYHRAMNTAISQQDYSYINQFYLYKICDSILELDPRLQDNYQRKIGEKK